MLSDLRVRLARVTLWGSAAIAIVSETIAMHKLPVTYAPEALTVFSDAVKEYEQAPALPAEELTNRLLAAKKAVFNDVDMDSMDRDTYAEMLEIRQDLDGAAPEKGTVDNLTELKKELSVLQSFLFHRFFARRARGRSFRDLRGHAGDPRCDRPSRRGSCTRTRSGACSRSARRKSGCRNAGQACAASPEAVRAFPSKNRASCAPAISSKDNKVEKQEQPLRHRAPQDRNRAGRELSLQTGRRGNGADHRGQEIIAFQGIFYRTICQTGFLSAKR